MKKFYWGAAGFVIFSSFLSIFLHYHICSLLETSGIFKIQTKLVSENLALLFPIVTLGVSMFVFSDRSNRILLAVFASISCLISFSLFYFGTGLAFNPNVYLFGLKELWKDKENAGKIDFLQNKYKCCGFYTVNEVPRDKCVFKRPNSCLFAMNKSIGNSLSRIGLFWIAEAIFFVAATFLLIEESSNESYNDGSIEL